MGQLSGQVQNEGIAAALTLKEKVQASLSLKPFKALGSMRVVISW
jgi:hypothetical protein